MALALVAERVMGVGEDYSMALSDVRGLVIKAVILSLKYVDRQHLFEALFPGHFLDWRLVQAGPCTAATARHNARRGSHGQNLLGDLHACLTLLGLFTWAEPARPEHMHPRLRTLRESLRAASLDVGGQTLACKLFLVQLLEGVPGLQAFEQLTCDLLRRDTQQACALLLATLSDAPASPGECHEVLCEVLGPALLVNTEALSACLEVSRRRHDEHRKVLQLKQMQAYGGRPRLRDRLELTPDQAAELDVQLKSWESYAGFCQLHQFANVLSENVKRQLYFLAAQTAWDWRPHTHAVIHHKGDLSAHVSQYPVSKPDPAILTHVITGLAMDGKPPFEELLRFRTQCFRSFPVTHLQTMTLSQVLRLYACAYQNPSLWKALWREQLCLMSPSIIQDTEAFVHATPFAAQAFVALLCR